MVLDARSEESLGPRLVCTTSTGKNKIIPLKLKKLIIGRSNEATLKLMHPSISRKHCVIEKRDNGFFVRNTSTTNSLYLNERNVTEQRLFSGDKLQLGTFSITFISDEKADTRQATQKIITKHTRSNRGVWLAALLIFIFTGYLLYVHAYTPWETRQKLAEVAGQIELGDYLPARDTLKQLLLADISSENAQTAKDMLAQITLAITQQKAEKGNVDELSGGIRPRKRSRSALGPSGFLSLNAWRAAGIDKSASICPQGIFVHPGRQSVLRRGPESHSPHLAGLPEKKPPETKCRPAAHGSRESFSRQAVPDAGQ